MARSTQIQVRLTEDEKAELEAKAKRHNLSVSAYLRAAALQREESGGTANIHARAVPRRQPVADLSAEDEAFENRVKELARTLPASAARRIAYQELRRPMPPAA